MTTFRDRADAGAQLAQVLMPYRHYHPVVLSLPRGGVVLGAEVARALAAPHDLIISRKIAHPFAPEYAIGAVAEGSGPVWGPGIDGSGIELSERARELQDGAADFRMQLGRASLLGGRTAIIVDDGIATGLTMEAAILEARHRGAARVVVAVPVAPPDARGQLSSLTGDIIILSEPAIGFGAVGQYYDEFEPVSTNEVLRLMQLDSHPGQVIDPESIQEVAANIKHYPVSSTAIALTARRLHAPATVVNFFESIPGGTTFSDRDDLINRSLEAEIIIEEEQVQPPEPPLA